MNTTLDALVGALYRHLACHALPTPITIGLALHTPKIEIQIDLADTVTRLGELVAWGHSLDQVTVTGWHTPDGNLHLTILGRTIGGYRVKVYGGVPYADLADLVSLPVGESAPLTLDELATLLANTSAGAA